MLSSLFSPRTSLPLASPFPCRGAFRGPSPVFCSAPGWSGSGPRLPVPSATSTDPTSFAHRSTTTAAPTVASTATLPPFSATNESGRDRFDVSIPTQGCGQQEVGPELADVASAPRRWRKAPGGQECLPRLRADAIFDRTMPSPSVAPSTPEAWKGLHSSEEGLRAAGFLIRHGTSNEFPGQRNFHSRDGAVDGCRVHGIRLDRYRQGAPAPPLSYDSLANQPRARVGKCAWSGAQRRGTRRERFGLATPRLRDNERHSSASQATTPLVVTSAAAGTRKLCDNGTVAPAPDGARSGAEENARITSRSRGGRKALRVRDPTRVTNRGLLAPCVASGGRAGRQTLAAITRPTIRNARIRTPHGILNAVVGPRSHCCDPGFAHQGANPHRACPCPRPLHHQQSR